MQSFSINDIWAQLRYVILYVVVFLSCIQNCWSLDPFHGGEFERGETQSTEDEQLSEESGHDSTQVDEPHEEVAVPSPKGPFPGYGPYRELFVEVCKQLGIDGYGQLMQDLAKELSSEKASCQSCRMLYKSLACRVPAKKDAAPPAQANAPSTELIAALSAIFSDIASRPEVAGETADAIAPLLDRLNQPTNPARNAYFEIFTEVIKVSLKQHFQQLDQTQKKKKEKQKQKQLDQLF